MKKALLVLAFLLPLARTQAATNSVDILWEGSGYVPPLYEGRALWGRQTQIKFFALPHIFSSSGKELSPSSLIYRWSKDGTVLGSLSGVGKNSIAFMDSLTGMPIEVRLDIMTDEDTVVASADSSYSASLPSVLVYEKSPSLGYLFNHEAGGGITMSGQEVTLAAFPFLFSAANKSSSSIDYLWTSSGSTPQPGESVTYRTPEGSAGAIPVSISADAPRVLLQSAEKSFLVQFGNE